MNSTRSPAKLTDRELLKDIAKQQREIVEKITAVMPLWAAISFSYDQLWRQRAKQDEQIDKIITILKLMLKRIERIDEAMAEERDVAREARWELANERAMTCDEYKNSSPWRDRRTDR